MFKKIPLFVNSKAGSAVIAELNVTPTTSAQQITAPTGTDGYSPVNVSAVTSSIDANIVAENIKKDVVILGVTGSLESGITPTGTKQITANGTHNVSTYEYAEVNVPTTAPNHYVKYRDGTMAEKDGAFMNFSGYTNAGSFAFYYACAYNGYMSGTVDMSSFTIFSNNSCCYGMYRNSVLSGVNLSNLQTISGQSACAYMFNSCTAITSVDLSSLERISGAYGCSNMFNGCTSLTSIDLSSLQNIGGSDGCSNMFNGCTSLTSIDLSSVTTIAGPNGCSNMFNGCFALTNVDLSGLTNITSYDALFRAFYNCTALTNIDLSSLTIINNFEVFYQAFYGCSNLQNLYFNSLSKISGSDSGVFAYTFRNSGLQQLYFPAFNNNTFISNNALPNTMLMDVTGCTIHFPSNLDPINGSTVISSQQGYPNFGGTNTVLLFDLPATNILNGADSVSYVRNPKYDTATALSWRVQNSSVTDTPYYTSGLTDPTVGTTIYSDSACTTAVTTVDSIA